MEPEGADSTGYRRYSLKEKLAFATRTKCIAKLPELIAALPAYAKPPKIDKVDIHGMLTMKGTMTLRAPVYSKNPDDEPMYFLFIIDELEVA